VLELVSRHEHSPRHALPYPVSRRPFRLRRHRNFGDHGRGADIFRRGKIPVFARGLGKAIREFKKATAGIEEEFKRAMEEPPKPAMKINPVQGPMNPPLPKTATPMIHTETPPAEHSDFEHGEN
jgi:Sec-independent protein translocase protein TatA